MVSMAVKTQTKTKKTLKPEVVATVHGVEVLAGRHLKRRIVETMNEGKFENPEISAGLGCILPGDRVVEMGSGSGTVGAVLAKNIKNVQIRSFEANPNLIDAIAGLYKHNKLTRRIKVQNNAVVAGDDAPKAIDFYVRSNFLGSRTSAENNEPDAEKISVETIKYDEVRNEFPHNVLMIDIEGAELDFLRDADLSEIDLVIIELHRAVYHRPGMNACRGNLERQGFVQDREFCRRGVFTYKKAHRLNPA
jgi:FkbM family methyltransferase